MAEDEKRSAADEELRKAEDERDLELMKIPLGPGEPIPPAVMAAAGRWVKRHYPRTGFTPPGMVRGRQ